MEKVRLWTVQTPLAWSLLQERRTLYGDGRRVDPDLRKAYKWIREQMKKRISGCQGKYPLWFFTHRHDLRTSCLATSGSQQVLLECLIPKERVLLSEYDTWHFVLNNWHVDCTEKESDAWDIESRTLSQKERRGKVQKSWELIFDLEALSRDPEWIAAEELQQATVEYLKYEEVVSAREFTAR